MVAIPMFMLLRDVIQALGKSIFVVHLVSILNFKMVAILDFKTAAIFNIFWPVSQLLSSLGSSKLWQYGQYLCLR